MVKVVNPVPRVSKTRRCLLVHLPRVQDTAQSPMLCLSDWLNCLSPLTRENRRLVPQTLVRLLSCPGSWTQSSLPSQWVALFNLSQIYTQKCAGGENVESSRGGDQWSRNSWLLTLLPLPRRSAAAAHFPAPGLRVATWPRARQWGHKQKWWVCPASPRKRAVHLPNPHFLIAQKTSGDDRGVK